MWEKKVEAQWQAILGLYGSSSSKARRETRKGQSAERKVEQPFYSGVTPHGHLAPPVWHRGHLISIDVGTVGVGGRFGFMIQWCAISFRGPAGIWGPLAEESATPLFRMGIDARLIGRMFGPVAIQSGEEP